jgi:uncharacterized Fe-S radical SAM superfamily protein PflX
MTTTTMTTAAAITTAGTTTATTLARRTVAPVLCDRRCRHREKPDRECGDEQSPKAPASEWIHVGEYRGLEPAVRIP